MKHKNTGLSVYCLIVGCILLTGIVAMSAFAAESNFQITGKVIIEGDNGDTPVEGATVSAIKGSSIESSADSDTSAADGSYTLNVPVDLALGAGDEFNKVQIRLTGSDTSYVNVCSPFLELLNYPSGYFSGHELIAQTVQAAESVLNDIGDVNRNNGILVGIVEYEDGKDITALPGVQFMLTNYPDGKAIQGVQVMYQSADGSWNTQTDRTTTRGVVVFYNIPLLESGWRDVTLTPAQIDGYNIGIIPWARVYAYADGDQHWLTFAEPITEKIISPEEENNTSTDGGGGGGGGGCFIATAMP